MDLPRSRMIATSLVALAETGSTNDDLVAVGRDSPDFAVIVAGSQTAGRGRLGRSWVAPPDTSLSISVLLRPVLPAGEPLATEHFGWLPLIAGAAMARAVATVVPFSPGPPAVGLKWPNDVQVDGLKVAGLLGELLPGGEALVMGAGVNLSLAEADLPTPVSTSLALQGAQLSGDALADAVLSAYLSNLKALYGDFLRLGADVEASGTRETVAEMCTTLGQQVRVELPGGATLVGTATGIDRWGRLQVRRSSDGQVSAVAAGDVTHLRYE